MEASVGCQGIWAIKIDAALNAVVLTWSIQSRGFLLCHCGIHDTTFERFSEFVSLQLSFLKPARCKNKFFRTLFFEKLFWFFDAGIMSQIAYAQLDVVWNLFYKFLSVFVVFHCKLVLVPGIVFDPFLAGNCYQFVFLNRFVFNWFFWCYYSTISL